MAETQRASRRLKAGTQALRRGNRVRARELLLEAVELDAELEDGWWLLYQAADSAHEKMRALEEVVRLHPLHPTAAGLLTELRQQQLQARSPRNPDWASLLPEVRLEADDGVDDPYQCPYCGLDTAVEDRKCPHCGKGLLQRVAKTTETGTLRLLLLLMGIALAAGLLEATAPLFALGYAQNSDSRETFSLIEDFVGVRLVLGSFTALAPATATLLLQLLAARSLALLAIIIGLSERWRLAYYAAIPVVLADLLLSGYFLITGYLGMGASLLNGGLALAMLVMLFSVNYDFAVNLERLLVKADTRARSAVELYARGHYYRRRGMWAMAVAQWRRAAGLAPGQAQYYKDLGIGYARIKRFGRSLQALEQAQHLAPANAEIGDIIALVKASAGTHRQLRR